MSKLVIKDLAESISLDRKAMRAVSGGARSRGRQGPLGQLTTRGNRIINYPSTLPMTKSTLFK